MAYFTISSKIGKRNWVKERLKTVLEVSNFLPFKLVVGTLLPKRSSRHTTKVSPLLDYSLSLVSSGSSDFVLVIL